MHFRNFLQDLQSRLQPHIPEYRPTDRTLGTSLGQSFLHAGTLTPQGGIPISAVIAGESFTLPDGIVGLALSPTPEPSPFNLPHLNKQKVLYFQPLATDRIFSVPTSALKTPPRPDDRENTLPVSLIGYKSSQSAVLAVNPSDGALVFNPLPETALTSWDPSTNHNKLLALDPNLLQFSSDLRFADRDSGNIWLISTRLQKLFRKTYSPKEINMRVMRIRIAPTPYNNSLYLF
uniref:Uncharacterized protein n=1 Tax=Timema monikensis TaxID=170555 RepID=A0A7R9HNU3_9NEOP|nr:unnamed protein product [Timema monikensis]